jgi:uncharacterized Tic20 family protein
MSEQTPPPAEPPAGWAAQPPLSPADERLWSILIALSPFLLGFIGPLIGYLVLKDRGPFVAWHSRQALNFSITMTIAYAVSAVLLLVFIGFITLIAASVFWTVVAILAAVAAHRGQFYRYPLTIEFVK